MVLRGRTKECRLTAGRKRKMSPRSQDAEPGWSGKQPTIYLAAPWTSRNLEEKSEKS